MIIIDDNNINAILIKKIYIYIIINTFIAVFV